MMSSYPRLRQLSHSKLLAIRLQFDEDTTRTTRLGPRTLEKIFSDDKKCFSVKLSCNKSNI